MVALPNNQYRVELKTPEIRKKVYESFCAHLAKGKAIKSWFYDDGEVLCSWMTILKYIEKYPQELDPIHKIISESHGYQIWEKITEDSADGKNKKANTASLQMVMRNKFGWDKQEKEQNLENPKEDTNELINKVAHQDAEIRKLKEQLASQSKAESSVCRSNEEI